MKKKILIISTNSDLAGAPVHVKDIVLGLKDKYEFSVGLGGNGEIKKILKSSGVNVYSILNLQTKINLIKDFKSLIELNNIIREVKPSILHAHSAKAGMLCRLALIFNRDINCIYTVHGWGFGELQPKIQSYILFFIEKILKYKKNVRYIYVSKYDQIKAVTVLGISKKIGVMIHNGVDDHNEISDTINNENIIMVARVAYQKDHITLLKAYSKINTNLGLTLVGGGVTSNEFQKKIRILKIEKKVECIDSSSSVPVLLKKSCIFVLASKYEGLPLSIIEAMCAGLPIIASNVGGIPELVSDGENGFLVEPENEQDLKSKIEILLNNPGLRERMGQASRNKFLLEFGKLEMLQKLSGVYDV